ncbi:MAG: hypothetical protein IH859_10025 [Chloroflexi bacterium]|nr:hypothetical protein [Chloroflexota bacterium]
MLMPPAAMQQAGQAAAPSAYEGEPISLNFKDVDLKDFFRFMHEISGLNFVLDPNVSGVVTIVLDEVPWDQAMAIVMRNNSLDSAVEGNVVRIATLATLLREEEQQRDLALAIEEAQPRVTVTRTLSYSRAGDMIATLKRFLSSRGDVIADLRTNTLIITDIQDVITRMDPLIKILDQKSQQVEIEARVVAASRSFARDIGSQLAAEYGAKDQRAKRRSATYRASFSFWAILTLLFVFLGMNKQLDLDGWFTETGRQFAINQGWYDLRWQIQEPMVVGIALIGVSLLALLLAITRSLLPRHTLAFVGTLLLVIFLILKTLSFHHLDNFLDRELASVRLGTIIEWIGMGCVALCAAKNCWWYKSGFIKPPINFAEESAPYRTG